LKNNKLINLNSSSQH